MLELYQVKLQILTIYIFFYNYILSKFIIFFQWSSLIRTSYHLWLGSSRLLPFFLIEQDIKYFSGEDSSNAKKKLLLYKWKTVLSSLRKFFVKFKIWSLNTFCTFIFIPTVKTNSKFKDKSNGIFHFIFLKQIVNFLPPKVASNFYSWVY